jgi:cation transport regulator ChaC
MKRLNGKAASEEDRVQRLVPWARNKRLAAVAIVIAGALGAMASFSDNLSKLTQSLVQMAA